MTKLLAFLLLSCFAGTNGFTTIQQKGSTFARTSSLQDAPQSVDELIATPDIWDPLRESLNTVPAFACTNDQGQPLQYQVGESPLAFFYLDVDAAKSELEKAKKEVPDLTLNLTPFPLGEVFEMGAKKLALIVPSQEGIESAGAPAGTNPIGQQVPLFGCMEMVENLPDGSSMVPLFLSQAEADEAIGMALDTLPDDQKDKFKINVFPLAGAVQMQAGTIGKRSFTYVPPTSSLDYLRSLE